MMNLLNTDTLYTFEIVYNNGRTARMSNARISDIETMANSSYYYPAADVASGVASIRLIGECGALNDSWWSGYNKAKDDLAKNLIWK